VNRTLISSLLLVLCLSGPRPRAFTFMSCALQDSKPPASLCGFGDKWTPQPEEAS